MRDLTPQNRKKHIAHMSAWLDGYLAGCKDDVTNKRFHSATIRQVTETILCERQKLKEQLRKGNKK